MACVCGGPVLVCSCVACQDPPPPMYTVRKILFSSCSCSCSFKQYIFVDCFGVFMSCFFGGSALKTVFVTFSQRFVKSARMYSICIQNAISKDLFVFCSSPTKATLDIYTLYTCTLDILLLPAWGEGKGEAIFCKETLPAVLYVSVSVFNGLL